MEDFPSPEDLWEKYLTYEGIETPDKREIVEQEYHSDDSGISPRYYQAKAVNRTFEAIAIGKTGISPEYSVAKFGVRLDR